MSANHTAGASRQISQEELNVLDAAKAWSKWYERAVEGLSMETYDRETHSLWNIIRALVASEAKHDREAQVDEHRAFTPKTSGSSPGPVIAAQGASDREAEETDTSAQAATVVQHPASASEPHEADCTCWDCWRTPLIADGEIRASIALDKGEDRTHNVDDDAFGSEEV